MYLYPRADIVAGINTCPGASAYNLSSAVAEYYVECANFATLFALTIAQHDIMHYNSAENIKIAVK